METTELEKAHAAARQVINRVEGELFAMVRAEEIYGFDIEGRCDHYGVCIFSKSRNVRSEWLYYRDLERDGEIAALKWENDILRIINKFCKELKEDAEAKAAALEVEKYQNAEQVKPAEV